MTNVSSSSAALCAACGLCCDGTIFRDVTLTHDESRRLESRGLVLERAERLPQPCPALQGTLCVVYTSRPGICERYRCALLKQVEQGDVPFDAAVAVVRETVDRRDLILRLGAALGVPADNRGVLALRQQVADQAVAPVLEPVRHQFLVETRALIYAIVNRFESSFGRRD